MKTIKQTLKLSLIGLSLVAAVIACKKDDDLAPVPPPAANEVEVMTTMTLTFVDPAMVQPTVTATFRDPDGDGGGGADIHDTIRLAAGTTYNCSIQILNELESPAEDVTVEILDEDDEHLFCFTPSGADVTIVRTDTDGTYEVGLESDWTTGLVSNGTVMVTLKHQPGVKDGTCAPGETDIEVTFVTEIQ